MTPKPRNSFRRALPFILFGFATVLISAFVAATISTQPDEFLYTFEPDPLPVTGPVTEFAVPIDGKQCFSSNRVFTVTSETWSYTLGPSAAPPGFAPFYTNAPATFEFSPEGRSLDADNCLVFLGLGQAPPQQLTEHLIEHCEATPNMSFRLNATAIDAETGRTSEIVIVSSEAFTFPERCEDV